MGKGPLELEGCPCIFAQEPPSSKLRHCAMTVVSGNVRLMRRFLGDEASNDSGVIENFDFQGFRTLRLWHLRK